LLFYTKALGKDILSRVARQPACVRRCCNDYCLGCPTR
jgi:hypothetical protein